MIPDEIGGRGNYGNLPPGEFVLALSSADPDVSRLLNCVSDHTQNIQFGVTRSRRLRDKVGEHKADIASHISVVPPPSVMRAGVAVSRLKPPRRASRRQQRALAGSVALMARNTMRKRAKSRPARCAHARWAAVCINHPFVARKGTASRGRIALAQIDTPLGRGRRVSLPGCGGCRIRPVPGSAGLRPASWTAPARPPARPCPSAMRDRAWLSDGISAGSTHSADSPATVTRWAGSGRSPACQCTMASRGLVRYPPSIPAETSAESIPCTRSPSPAADAALTICCVCEVLMSWQVTTLMTGAANRSHSRRWVCACLRGHRSRPAAGPGSGNT